MSPDPSRTEMETDQLGRAVTALTGEMLTASIRAALTWRLRRGGSVWLTSNVPTEATHVATRLETFCWRV
jgi:hypothetical protein